MSQVDHAQLKCDFLITPSYLTALTSTDPNIAAPALQYLISGFQQWFLVGGQLTTKPRELVQALNAHFTNKPKYFLEGPPARQ